MQTIVDRKVTNTKMDRWFERKWRRSSLSFQAEFVIKYETAHDRIPARNTLLYDDQQKRQMRL